MKLSKRLRKWKVNLPAWTPLDYMLREDVNGFADEVKVLESENARLRELAGLLLYGMKHDAPPHEVLLWSQKVNRLVDELGIELAE